MPQRPLESLGAIVRERRGQHKLREVAREIGISAATLMRVEAGRIPDLATFGKICKWLKMDPREFLGVDKTTEKDENEKANSTLLSISAHFRFDRTPNSKTVKALAQMLLVAARTQPTAHED
jgi:transcriptional regulator with XRE-family HTH domain